MKYYYLLGQDPSGGWVKQILTVNHDLSVTSFADVESNQGPERYAYLEWLAGGNTPEPWPPAE